MGLNEVSSILWQERQLLEVLLFKMEEEQLILASGRTRWLARATHEVNLVLEEIRRTELARAVEVDAVAGDLGLAPNPSLQALAEAAPRNWHDLLTAHRHAFLSLTQEISTLAEANRELVQRGHNALRDTLRFAGALQDDETYEPTGRAAPAMSRSRLVDQAF